MGPEKEFLRLSLFGRILVPKLLRINSNKDHKYRVGLYDYDLPLLFIEYYQDVSVAFMVTHKLLYVFVALMVPGPIGIIIRVSVTAVSAAALQRLP